MIENTIGFREETENTIIFICKETEMLRLEEDGSFFVQGRKVVNDQEVYTAFKKWMQQSGIFQGGEYEINEHGE